MNGELLNVNRDEAFEVDRLAPQAEQLYEIYPRRMIENTSHNKMMGYNENVGRKDYARYGTSQNEWVGAKYNLLKREGLQFESTHLTMKKQPKTVEKVYDAEDVEKEIKEDVPTGVVEEVVAKRGTDFTPTKQTEVDNVEMNNQPEREDMGNQRGLPNVNNDVLMSN